MYGAPSKKVLIVDDDPITRTLLNKNIHDAGYNVVTAENGKKAIELMSNEVAVAILDLRMPEMDGMECLHYINNHFKDMQTIIATASNDISDAVEAMKIGAFDYITKPFDMKELIVLVRKAVMTHEQLKRLRKVESELALAKEREISMASRIQQALLLGQPPRDFKGLIVAPVTIASQSIDGDFYDFYITSDRCLDIVVGDVMGKGIQAALLGAATKNQFLQALNTFRGPIPDPKEIVSLTNSKMVEELETLETFVTLCYGRFDLEKSNFDFVDCGHTRTIHFKDRSDTFNFLKGFNMPLGFPGNVPIIQSSVHFDSGDLFLFYSDGITEARRPDGEFYGEERLVNFIRENKGIIPQKLVKMILQDVLDYTGSEKLADDVTCVAVIIDENGYSGILYDEARLEINSDLKGLGRIRAFIRKFCERVPANLMETNQIFLIEIAVTEVASNIIKHSYGNQSGKKIQIEAEVTKDHMKIRFFDWGEAFDPNAVRPPVFDGTRENGFGLHIISKSVDEVSYSSDENGRNRVDLMVKLKEDNLNGIRN